MSTKFKFFIPTILILLIIFGLVSLGFWQLQRAEEKRLIEAKIIQAGQIPAQKIATNDIIDKQYYQVLLTGYYDSSKQFIYDNQIVNSTAGYFVLTPFVLENQQAILVNRGFIPWRGRRDKLADIDINDKQHTIQVKLRKPVERIKLKQQSEQVKFPLIIQSLNIQKLNRLTHYQILPMLAQLDKDEKYGFFRKWQPFYGSVDKHLGYALQWFLMALVLFIIGIILWVKNSKNRVIAECEK